MNVADKDRLSKLVGMLGSSFDGERSNAARMIQAMADKYKLTVDQLMAASYGGGQQQRQKPSFNDDTPPWRDAEPVRPKPRPKPEGLMPDDMLEALRECADMPTLTPWERQFAEDVGQRYDRDYQLTERQMVVVQRILEKASRAGYWGGF